MGKKKSPSSSQILGLPREVFEQIVGDIDLSQMDYGEAEEALERVKTRVGELAMAEVIKKLGPEGRTAKPCPRCGKKVPVKTPDEPRKIIGMSGVQILKRNYHYCGDCKEGFHPRDLELGLSKKTPFSPELEKRILDFGVNEPYAECEERFALHYASRLSTNAFRQVVKRVGEQLEKSAMDLLQMELSAPEKEAADVLYVMNDGSMLSTREGWKESKVGLTFRARANTNPSQFYSKEVNKPRFCAVLGNQEHFYHEFSELLEVEQIDRARLVVWLADGALGNWTLASACAKYAIQILDFWHAVENGSDCGKVLLELDPIFLELWNRRLKQLLLAGDFQSLISELMDCILEADDHGLASINKLLTYYQNNKNRMDYRRYLEQGLYIGSGAVESAHRHVLQKRMKLAGQQWSITAGRRMAGLRAAYRTGGPTRLHSAIQSAHRNTQHKSNRSGRHLKLVA